MKRILIMAMMAVSINTALTCSEDGSTGIAPENDLKIGVNAKNSNGMTEEVFNATLDSVEKVYGPIIASDFNARLHVERSWDNGTVNAYAQRSRDENGDVYKIRMFGGLARHEEASADALALVACHEIGHHIGGAPKKTDWNGNLRWASNEGQSDYWGTLKCARRIWLGDNNQAIVGKMAVPSVIAQKCEGTFENEDERAVCKRASMAGLALAKLLRAIRTRSDGTNPLPEVDFNTPDTNVRSSTDHNHPKPQCRLDTYFAGAVCPMDFNTNVDQIDANLGTCNRRELFSEGLRPLCWFKPSDAEEEE